MGLSGAERQRRYLAKLKAAARPTDGELEALRAERDALAAKVRAVATPERMDRLITKCICVDSTRQPPTDDERREAFVAYTVWKMARDNLLQRLVSAPTEQLVHGTSSEVAVRSSRIRRSSRGPRHG
jgi:hypothetical protein